KLKEAKAAGQETAEWEAAVEESHKLEEEWRRQTVLGRLGQAIEPAVQPLGWDWRIGVAALASFPAREVVVGVLGIVYDTGKTDTDEVTKTKDLHETPLGQNLRAAFPVPVALSLMVFFALCCQCASTLVVMRRETGTWGWPLFTFAYMTGL